MNLLDKFVPREIEKPPEDTYSIGEFRQMQYSMIPELITTGINYLQKISNNHIIFKDIQEQGLIKYLDAYGYLIKKVIVNIEDTENREKVKPIITFNLPRLVKKSFFYLNGSYYCPCLYINDKPIIYKKNSIKLYGLINSITMYFKVGHTRTIFGGKNIPINYFLQWFIDDQSLLTEIEDRFDIDSTVYSKKQLLNYFSNFFNCSEDEETINNYFNNLFFDEYTKNLYKMSYGKEFTFQDLVYYSLINFVDEEKQINFVDLNEKRIVFAEMLLTPFFQRIGDMAFNFIGGQKFDLINFNENEIIKHFMVDMKHQFFYDLVNFYSGILVQKASFVGPNMKSPPSEVSSVHPSHFGKICPITISAKKPGESVSIVPGARVNKYGIFV